MTQQIPTQVAPPLTHKHAELLPGEQMLELNMRMHDAHRANLAKELAEGYQKAHPDSKVVMVCLQDIPITMHVVPPQAVKRRIFNEEGPPSAPGNAQGSNVRQNVIQTMINLENQLTDARRALRTLEEIHRPLHQENQRLKRIAEEAMSLCEQWRHDAAHYKKECKTREQTFDTLSGIPEFREWYKKNKRLIYAKAYGAKKMLDLLGLPPRQPHTKIDKIPAITRKRKH